MFLLADRVIGGPRSLTAEEVAERSGIGLDFLLASRRAMGLPIPEPGEAAFTENDLEAARRSLVATEAGISEEDLLELLRVLGRGLAQAAETMRELPLKLVLRAGISELELAQHYGETVARLYPMVDPLMSDILALHLRHATETDIVGAAERDGGRLPGSRRVAIGFADLVGFTRLGEEVPPDELGRLATRLEAIALEVASPPVRLVKTIGDAVMLASPEAEPLVEAALGLIDVAEGEGGDFPELRAGAALGARARAGRRLVRAARQPRQPHHLGGASEQPAGGRPALRIARQRLPRLVRRRAPAEGDPRAGGPVQDATSGGELAPRAPSPAGAPSPAATASRGARPTGARGPRPNPTSRSGRGRP